MTKEDGLYIQAAQLAVWKTKLNEQCYQDLERWVKLKNSLLKEDANGYAVIRGVDLDQFIANWRPIR